MAGRIVLSSSAYKRRLVSSLYSGRYYHASSSITTSAPPFFTERLKKESNKRDSLLLNALPTVRTLSVSSSTDDNLSRTTTTRRERAAASARRGAKVARKGARTAGELMQQYGPVFVGTYLGIYCATLASLFAGIDSGLLDPVTVISYFHFGPSEVASESKSTVDMVVHMLEEYSWTKPYASTVAKNPHCANLAVAWVATKFTEPIRLLLAIGIVPRVAKWLGREPVKHHDSDDENEKDDKVHATAKKE